MHFVCSRDARRGQRAAVVREHRAVGGGIRALGVFGGVSLLTASCTLLAPGADDLSGSWGLEGDATPEAAPIADTGPRACVPGTKRCGDACVSKSNPATGCAGDSCAPCAFDHAEALCVGGACAMGPCEAGFADCDRTASSGCEADTRVSSSRCGSCDLACGATSPLCVDSACVPKCHAVKITARAARLSLPTTGMSVGAGDFTLEVWVRRHGEFVTGGYVFMGADSTHEGLPSIQVRVDGRVVCGLVQAGGTPQDNAASAKALDAAWHHVACVRSAGQLTVYVDGVASGSVPSAIAVTSAEAATVGGWPSSPLPYEAAPVVVGPVRYSRVARYKAAFAPRSFWRVDGDTVLQYLTTQAFNGDKVVDEAGGDNPASHVWGVIASEEDVPCVAAP